jgi:4-hydroxysphinganine ceramide fatty acyl 2-hydroxylase
MVRFLPAHSAAYTLHFLLHGVHHFLPMDRYRLVMPPLLFSVLSGSVWALARCLALPPGIQEILFSGAFVGYVCYDLMHYHFHHGMPFSGYIRAMKTYHMDHHYVDENLGFGVSSKVWDQVFGTALPEHFALKARTKGRGRGKD